MEDTSETTIVSSKHTIEPKQNQNPTKLIHLTPFDLKTLSIQYIQKGLVFHKPQNQSTPSIISNLLSSFSQAVDLYYPLSGRLLTTRHKDDRISISLLCNHKGAEFTHANASHIKLSDIITPNNYYITPIIRSFFPLNGLINNEGHDEPLLGVQVTQLSDGFFIGCSLNHCAGDGNTFWKFINTWSDISRNKGGSKRFGGPLKFERWFPESVTPPVCMSLERYVGIKNLDVPYVPECFFQFSSDNVKRLKEKANKEMNVNNISSLQASVAHMWKSVTRARVACEAKEENTFCFVAEFRSKMDPPLPETYIGNALIERVVKVSAWEIQSKCLGFTASVLNRAMNMKDEARVFESFESWSKDPAFVVTGERLDGCLFLSSSPRFDVYGNDFGWGEPVAVRSGPGNKLEGKMTVYPGANGGIDLEFVQPEDVMEALLQDQEFMEYVL